MCYINDLLTIKCMSFNEHHHVVKERIEFVSTMFLSPQDTCRYFVELFVFFFSKSSTSVDFVPLEHSFSLQPSYRFCLWPLCVWCKAARFHGPESSACIQEAAREHSIIEKTECYSSVLSGSSGKELSQLLRKDIYAMSEP